MQAIRQAEQGEDELVGPSAQLLYHTHICGTVQGCVERKVHGCGQAPRQERAIHGWKACNVGRQQYGCLWLHPEAGRG